MRILTVSHTAGSRKHGMVFRPFYLSREFVRAGHTATIVSASFSHNRYTNPNVEADLEQDSVDNVGFIWLRTPRYKGEALRALGMLIFAVKLLWHARRLASEIRPDIVIATAPDPLVSFGAWLIASRSGAKFVFEFRDLWPLTLIELAGKSRWHPFILLLSAAERFGLRRADLVVSVLSQGDRYLRETGIVVRRLAKIANGVSLSEDQRAAAVRSMPIRQKMTELRAGGRFVLGYVGNHATANSLGPLIVAMRELSDSHVVVFVGDGSDKPVLQKLAGELRVSNVLFFDPIPKDEVQQVLALFDACYIGSQPSRLYSYGASPNKIFDYMLAAKPIVSALATESDVVSESGCGIRVREATVAGIKEAISRMSALPVEQRIAMGQRGREFVVRNHGFGVLAQRYLDELSALS